MPLDALPLWGHDVKLLCFRGRQTGQVGIQVLAKAYHRLFECVHPLRFVCMCTDPGPSSTSCAECITWRAAPPVAWLRPKFQNRPPGDLALAAWLLHGWLHHQPLSFLRSRSSFPHVQTLVWRRCRRVSTQELLAQCRRCFRLCNR